MDAYSSSYNRDFLRNMKNQMASVGKVIICGKQERGSGSVSQENMGFGKSCQVKGVIAEFQLFDPGQEMRWEKSFKGNVSFVCLLRNFEEYDDDTYTED